MKKVICFIILLLLIPLINTQPPFAQDINLIEGYEIKYPANGVLQANKHYTFFFHVFNKSNGMPVGITDANCSFHLYNETGDHTIDKGDIFNDGEHGVINEWETFVTAGNFTNIGSYSYIIQCNSTSFGGFESVGFEVTPTGTILETSDSITYIILTFCSILLFLLCLYGGLVLPFSNRRDDNGIISVDKLKYFKVGLLFLSYVLFVWMLNLLFSLSNNFSILTQYTAFFEIMFVVMNAMSYPIFVFMLILMGALAWKDLQLKKLLKRGFSP